jgi:VIT1/CCC1 family predicted Fe2+/Mn2+ transporter
MMRNAAVDDRSLPDASEPHETRANSVLRPIVFGANDGLVSNLALVMGVAGATSDNGIIVLAGVAGLIAGAFSMGVGEYVSVQSQRELLDYQLAFQRKQLREAPDQERAILAKLYVERGFGREEADRFVDAVFADPDHAVRLLIFEEVGLDARSIGSPLAAAAGSFVAFTTGAFIPLVPYLLGAGMPAFAASLSISLGALALLGAGIAVLTRRPAWYGALRQVCLGAVAAGFTYAVGLVIGVRAA